MIGKDLIKVIISTSRLGVTIYPPQKESRPEIQNLKDRQGKVMYVFYLEENPDTWCLDNARSPT
jgi:hypothetical protein